MKKFLTVLCLCVISFNAFCAEPHYNCQLQQSSGNVTKTLKFQNGNLVCGHMGTDGCKDGTFVSIRQGVPEGKSPDIPIYYCHAYGINMWYEVPVSKIRDCGTDVLPKFLGSFDGNYVYYELEGDGEELLEACKINLADAERNCINTDGEWVDNKCECLKKKEVEKAGGLDVSPCKCVADLEFGTDLDGNNPHKCWPKPYLQKKCLKYRDGSGWWRCPTYPGSYGSHHETNPTYLFLKGDSGDCVCDDWDNNSRICINGDHAEYRGNCNCPGFSFDAVWDAYFDDSWEWGKDNDGFDCYKPQSQYNYQICSNDNDCKNIDNKKRPYLHSTAWKCIEQTPGVHVCAARECETGWEPKNGYCQESKTTQTPQSENKNAVSGVKTETKAAVTKICADPNMDADCKCTRVAETVKSGDKCVCIDKNKEIKGGKCEYTAAYRSTLKADIDSKYSKIKSLTAGFEANKWRDAEGNFNTARLASDSIAGVVLGTAGGIITSKLVKKNQLKKGFEDIQCHIGGQSVADYGDEFTVGW